MSPKNKKLHLNGRHEYLLIYNSFALTKIVAFFQKAAPFYLRSFTNAGQTRLNLGGVYPEMYRRTPANGWAPLILTHDNLRASLPYAQAIRDQVDHHDQEPARQSRIEQDHEQHLAMHPDLHQMYYPHYPHQ